MLTVQHDCRQLMQQYTHSQKTHAAVVSYTSAACLREMPRSWKRSLAVRSYLKLRVFMQNLDLPPEACTADLGAWWQVCKAGD